jgi:hypothetical protein
VPAHGQVATTLTVTARARSILRAGDLVRVVEPGRVGLWAGGCSDERRCAPGAAAAFAVEGASVEIDKCPPPSPPARAA